MVAGKGKKTYRCRLVDAPGRAAEPTIGCSQIYDNVVDLFFHYRDQHTHEEVVADYIRQTGLKES